MANDRKKNVRNGRSDKSQPKINHRGKGKFNSKNPLQYLLY